MSGPVPTLVNAAAERSVLNSNMDITNVVEHEQFVSTTIKTLDQIITTLSAHCGPKSDYSMLVTGSGASSDEFSPNIFTRDGIRILDAVEFMAPLQDCIKKIITYIGRRVDSKAKDGTTTSMLFATLFLKHSLEGHMDKIRPLGLSLKEQHRLFENMVAAVIDKLNNYVLTTEKLCALQSEASGIPTTPAQLAVMSGEVAYMQALSSSGGDVELAKSMRTVYANSMRESWDKATHYHNTTENDIRFEVRSDEFDFRVRINLDTPDVLNSNLSTEFVGEDVTILAYPDALTINSIPADKVAEFLKSWDTDKYLLLLATQVPATITMLVHELNASRSKPIAVCLLYPNPHFRSEICIEIMSLIAIANKTPWMDLEANSLPTEKHLIVCEKAQYHHTYLDLFGLVELEEGTCLHPSYLDKSRSQAYNEIYGAIKRQVDYLQQGHEKNQEMIKAYVNALYSITTIRRPTLWLGGTSHEQLANKEVVNDVQGAVMSALTSGFTVNGPISLIHAIAEATKEEYRYSGIDSGSPSRTYSRYMLEALGRSAMEVFNIVYQEFRTNIVPHLFDSTRDDPTAYYNLLCLNEHLQRGVVGGDYDQTRVKPFTVVDFLERHIGTNYDDSYIVDYPVAQPVAIVTELLRRVNELVIKVCNTDKLQVAGGVYLKDRDTPQSTHPKQ